MSDFESKCLREDGAPSAGSSERYAAASRVAASGARRDRLAHAWPAGALSLEEAYRILQKNHRALMKSYSVALDSLARLHQERSDLHSLSAWALRMSWSGWALIYQGKIRLTNSAFDELDQRSDDLGNWHPLASPEASPRDSDSGYPGLRALALGEAALIRSGAESIRTGRFGRGTTFVEMIVERTAPENGRTTTLAVVRDATRLVKMEEEVAAMQRSLLQQQNLRVLGELSVGVAHDLHNLLAALAYRLAALELSPRVGAVEAESLETMNRILASGKALVSKLQAVARPVESSLTAVDLASVIASAVEIAQSGFNTGSPSKTYVIRTLVPALPRVWGSPDDLRNMFLNLLLNAADAMVGGGTIAITAEASPDAIVLLVEDEGVGVPQADLERIFEPFFSTKAPRGSGVGLALARETMTRAGGEIRARNRAQGGACFELRFVTAQSKIAAPEPDRAMDARAP